MAARMVSQAPAFDAGVLDIPDAELHM